MTNNPSFTESAIDVESSVSRRRMVDSVVVGWESGEAPDAAVVVAGNPSLGSDRSLLIELAYNEFRLRRRNGEKISSEEFCRRFPTIEYSLRQFLNCCSILSGQPDLRVEKETIKWPRIGENVADFAILDELGHGAFSRVYLAQQPTIGDRLVAVKVSSGQVGEAKALGRLSHPNIVPLYSVHPCDGDGLFLLCMPHRARATLADALDTAIASVPNGLTGDLFNRVALAHGDDRPARERAVLLKPQRSYVDAVLEIGMAIAGALSHAHACGILHLDVKPSNVLLAFDGAPLLVDFNLSKDQNDLHGSIGGTLPYMAPEVLDLIGAATDWKEKLDGRTDVYSLGVLLYQLLNLKLPYEIKEFDMPVAAVASLQARRIAWEPPPFQLEGVSIDERTRTLIRRLLAVDPTRRPTAVEAVAELKACLSFSARLRRRARARPAISTVLAGTILSAVVLLPIIAFEVFRTVGADRAHDPRSTSEANLVTEDRAKSVADELQRARALLSTKQFPQALRVFEDLQASEKRVDALAGIIYCACRLKQFPRAAEVGKQYRAAGGTDAGVLNNFGHALRNMRDFKDADKVLTDACNATSPPLDAALFNRAYIDIAQSHHRNEPINPRTLSDLRELATRDVKAGEPYFCLAVFLINGPASQLAQPDEPAKLLRNAVKYGASPQAVMTLAPGLRGMSLDELREIAAGGAESGRRFNLDPLVSPAD